MEKVKKTNTKPAQHSASSRVRPARSIGLERKLEDGRKIDAPGKQPQQVEHPEIQTRDGVVVARIAQIQKAKKLLVDEKNHKKP